MDLSWLGRCLARYCDWTVACLLYCNKLLVGSSEDEYIIRVREYIHDDGKRMVGFCVGSGCGGSE